MTNRADMAKGPIKYVRVFQDRHGHWRAYFRRKGWKRDGCALPGATAPGTDLTEELLAGRQAALDAGPIETSPEPAKDTKARQGSLDALRIEYLGSAEFRSLRASTQREYRYAIEAVCRTPHTHLGTLGKGLVSELEPKHIARWRDALGTKFGAANKMVRVLKLLFNFGISRGYCTTNPAKDIKLLKGGRYRSWTDDELARFERRWPLGTLERTGFALAYYTGQRCADVVKIRWEDIAGKRIMVRQGKTGTQLQILMHPELLKVLGRWKRTPGTILKGERGNALHPVYFGDIMATAIETAGLPKDCVLHGLRKAAARSVAESGGNVAAVTGHLSASMVAEYTRDAEQMKLADDAVERWSKPKRTKAEGVKPKTA